MISNLPDTRPTPEMLEKARAERAAKVADWAKLPLRQKWADEGFMRAHLTAAGLRVGSSHEPATVARVRSLLRRVDILGEQIAAAVGGSLESYLARNPNLPLWAAVALLLEADGCYTDQVLAA